MAATETKISPKTIALVVGVVLLVAFAIWQGARTVSGAATDVTYTPPVKPPPDSARPPGFEKVTPPGGTKATGE